VSTNEPVDNEPATAHQEVNRDQSQKTPAVPATDADTAASGCAQTVREKLALARVFLVFTEIDDLVLDAALRGGVDMAEILTEGKTDEEIIAFAHQLKPVCDRHHVPLLLSARAELVQAAGADGVHLGQADDIEAARAAVGPDRVIGLSTHTQEQIDAAVWSGVDYISIGPVSPTWYAPDKPAIGTKLLTYASRNIDIPFFAAGGVQVENTGALAAAGAQRVVVNRAIVESHAPDKAAEFIRDEIIHPSDFLERYRARTESQNAAARAKLTPLEPNERPPALLIAIFLCVAGALINVIAFGAGLKVEGTKPGTDTIVIFAVVALALAYGMWRKVYQAVLLFMAVVSIVVVLFALFLIEASNLLGVLVGVVICFGGGTLLWKLIRVAGRIQAPERPARPAA
jgi:thiamine-phosphate pyrophosphorylase